MQPSAYYAHFLMRDRIVTLIGFCVIFSGYVAVAIEIVCIDDIICEVQRVHDI